MPSHFNRAVLPCLLFLCVAGCRDAPSEAENFVLDGKIFVFNYRVATATYLVNIKPTMPVTQKLVAAAAFEDPAGGAPIMVRETIWPQAPRTTIISPPVFCIVKERPYTVSIEIADDKGQPLQHIETTVTSSQDQTDLPDIPLVVGPLYTPNPALKGHPDGKLAERPRCPV